MTAQSPQKDEDQNKKIDSPIDGKPKKKRSLGCKIFLSLVLTLVFVGSAITLYFALCFRAALYNVNVNNVADLFFIHTLTPSVTPINTMIPTSSRPAPTATATYAPLPPELQAFQDAVNTPQEVMAYLENIGWVYSGDPEDEKYGRIIGRSPYLSLKDGFGDCSEFALIMAVGLEDDGYIPHFLGAMTDPSDPIFASHIIFVYSDEEGKLGYVDRPHRDSSEIYYVEPQFDDINELAKYYQDFILANKNIAFTRFYESTEQDLIRCSVGDWRTEERTNKPGIAYSYKFELPVTELDADATVAPQD